MAPLKPLMFAANKDTRTLEGFWDPAVLHRPQPSSYAVEPSQEGEAAPSGSAACRQGKAAATSVPQVDCKKAKQTSLLRMWQGAQQAAPLQVEQAPKPAGHSATPLLLPGLPISKGSRNAPHSILQPATKLSIKALASFPRSLPGDKGCSSVTAAHTKAAPPAPDTSPKGSNDSPISDSSGLASSPVSSSSDVSSEWVPTSDEEQPDDKRRVVKKAKAQAAARRTVLPPRAPPTAHGKTQPFQQPATAAQAAKQTAQSAAVTRVASASLPVQPAGTAACDNVPAAAACAKDCGAGARIMAKATCVPGGKFARMASGYEIPLMLGQPAALCKASEQLVLVQMPPDFDVEGDAGVIGRVCAPVGAGIGQDTKQLCASHPISQSSSDGSLLSLVNSPDNNTYAPQATRKEVTRDKSGAAAVGVKQGATGMDEQQALVLDLKGEVYTLACIPLQSTALLVQVKGTNAGQVCDVQATFSSVCATHLLGGTETGGVAAYAHDFDDNDSEVCQVAQAAGDGLLDSPAKPKKARSKASAPSRSKPRTSKVVKRANTTKKRSSKPSTVKRVAGGPGKKRVTIGRAVTIKTGDGDDDHQHDVCTRHKKARTN